MTAVRITIYLPPDVAAALHQASLAAGGYGHKSRIVEEAVRSHPEVRAQLEQMQEARR